MNWTSEARKLVDSQASNISKTEFPARTFRWMRLGLGVTVFGLYAFMMIFRQNYPGSFGFASLRIPFLQLPEVMAHPPFSVAVYCFGLVCSLGLFVGFGARFFSAALLVTHVAFNGGAVPYSWDILIDPLLVFMFLGTFERLRSGWLIQVMKIVTCLSMAWIGWSQIPDSPWLDAETVRRYLMHSPFAWIYPSCLGFKLLLDVIGGSAWLLQMTAPIALWHRSVGKYVALLALVSQALLQVLMPPTFWNFAGFVGLIAFLPQEWLTLDKSYWETQSEKFAEAGRAFGALCLTAVMLCTVFDRNIAEQFDIFDKIGSAPVEKAYEIVTNPFVRAGNFILFNSIWKMYSPVWRRVVWIDWYAKNPNGAVVNVPQENFSPDYRMRRRTWTEAIWTDFKKEKVFVGMLSDKRQRDTYSKYLCHLIQKTTGVKPISIRPEINIFQIHNYDDENWSLKSQKAEKVQPDPENPCE